MKERKPTWDRRGFVQAHTIRNSLRVQAPNAILDQKHLKLTPSYQKFNSQKELTEIEERDLGHFLKWKHLHNAQIVRHSYAQKS